jgi:hypothetical protein
VLKLVAASAAEAELGALFLNAQEVKILRLILEEMGHPQPPMPIHCDNKTAVGIANDTAKRQRSRAMEMCYFWVTDQVCNQYLDVSWHPGAENLGDYPTKHHPAKHHQHVRPIYTHQDTSPQLLKLKSTLRGCVHPTGSALQQTRAPVTTRDWQHPDVQRTCHNAAKDSVSANHFPSHNLLRT